MFKYCISVFLGTRIFYIFIICLSYSFLGKWELPSEVIGETNKDTFILIKYLYSFLKHFYAYDAVHFIHIGEKGYTTDLNYVFFPLFPILIKYLRLILLLPDETYSYILSGLIISNSLCFANTLVLYKLAEFFLKSHSKARVACFLFLVNPGTIFFISVYSESLYFLLSQLFILFIVTKQYEKRIFAFIFFMVITMTVRSTSIFSAVYFCIPIINEVLTKINYQQSAIHNLKKIISACYSKKGIILKFVGLGVIFYGLFFYMTSLRPRSDICYSVYKKMKHANNHSNFNMLDDSNLNSTNYITKENLVETQNLFNQSEMKINKEYFTLCRETDLTFNFYSHIQKKYWDVSFLSQFKLDKLDRLILSIPMNVLGLLVILSFINKFNFVYLKNLQLDKFILDDREYANYTSHIKLDPNLNKDHNPNILKSLNKSDIDNLINYKSFLFASYLNFIINFLVVVLIAHPQINNRVYSTCPIIYLFSAEEVISFSLNKKTRYKGFFIILFFFLFSVLGCIMQVGSYGFA